MDDICRLCCSSKFVNNNIFDEENALYLKMSLYLPIKVFKNDRLPQKVCDKCSCKVNDFYQFCNETIEVQNRLRSLLHASGFTVDESVDLTLIKDSSSPPPASIVHCEQATQTELPENLYTPYIEVDITKVKDEPKPFLSPIKEENFYNDNFEDRSSDSSENMSLITLKQLKRSKSRDVNGKANNKQGRKKHKLKEWEQLMSALPEGTAITVINNKDNMNDKKTKSKDLDMPMQIKKLKSEPSEVDIFHCCICLIQCYSRNEMLQHYKQHGNESSLPFEAPVPPDTPDTDQEQLRCTRCGKKVDRLSWVSHWQRHYERDRRPYRCSLCESTFRDHAQILKHGLTHKYGAGAGGGAGGGAEGEPVVKRFLCDICPQGFVQMRYLLSHRTRAHPEALSRALAMRCGVCEREFAHLNSLRRHLRAHTGERNFLCNVCGKSLSSREHLKFHIRIHTGYKPNVCNTCGKGFVKKCNLLLHERVHSGEKPHVCSHCGKAFSQRSTLVIHERYHSGARPYVCGLCGRGFVAKGLLTMHLKTTCI